MPTAVSFVLIALFCSSCVTSRKVTQGEARTEVLAFADSLVRIERLKTVEPIPMEMAKLEIPMDSLRKLPIDAEYRAKRGRASAVVKSRGDTIAVYATCDSLLRQCEYYERESATYKEAYEKMCNLFEEVREKRSTPIRTVTVSFLAGVTIGVLLSIIVKTKLKI